MKKLFDAVEKHRSLILDAERHIWKTPETGYREVKTTAYLAEHFRALGYTLHMAEGITGFYTDLDTGRPGATVLVMAELDSILCPSHPESDPETGAVHSCGHHAQCAALLGIAAALKEPGVAEALSGVIRLCAVPAEELLELEFRTALRDEGRIKYFGGKPEFLSRGYFDGVDIAFMVHTTAGRQVRLTKGSVGCRAKKIVYKGTAAHAGGSPWNGHNALYAATCGINAINAIRETFMEKDVIRVHPIMTHGGAMVNAIPDHATLESYVRGISFEAIDKANDKVNRALIGAALSIGCNVDILDSPGYAPLKNSPELAVLAEKAASLALPEVELVHADYSSGSTDNGDLAAVMPVLQPYCGGAVGNAHGSDYYIDDPELACVGSAKFQLSFLALLTEDGGKIAKEIKRNYVPQFPSAKDYLAYLDSLTTSGDRIIYNESTATVLLK